MNGNEDVLRQGMDDSVPQLLQSVCQDQALAFHKVSELLHELQQMRVCIER